MAVTLVTGMADTPLSTRSKGIMERAQGMLPKHLYNRILELFWHGQSVEQNAEAIASLTTFINLFANINMIAASQIDKYEDEGLYIDIGAVRFSFNAAGCMSMVVMETNIQH